jgi:YVTN family beta-propeller protein
LSVGPGVLWTRQKKPHSPLELRAPAGSRPVKVNPLGLTVLPNGRLITPRGAQVQVAPHPYGLALSPDGRTVVTSNSGTHPFSVSIITGFAASGQGTLGPGARPPTVAQMPPGFKSADADPDSVYLGVAIGPDNRTLYVSEGNNGHVGTFDLETHQRLGTVSLDGTFQGKTYSNSLTGDLKLSPDGRMVYVLDVAHFRLVVIEALSRQILASLPVGRLPLALAVSPDGRLLYICNAGTFRYSLVPGFQAKDAKTTGLDFPAFGFPSPEAEHGVTVDGKQIAGLGDPNVPESNSLWAINVSNPAQPRVIARIKTGIPVGEQSVGGSSPGAVAAGKQKVYVSNASQDTIAIIDAQSNRVERTVLLEPAETVRGLRGVLPFGLALSPDERRLYVACAGINAVAVLDARDGKVKGYIPTGWFPARVAVSADRQTLYVSNGKGFGAGPNGGRNFQEGPEGAYIGDITKGEVSIIPVPGDRSLKAETARVLRNNGFSNDILRAPRGPDFPIPRAGQASAKIRHLVFIVKENRTFDQVFGDLTEVGGEHVESERGPLEYGEDLDVKGDAKTDAAPVAHANVTPNHHALARRFGISDNYYVDSDVSVDGHHWLVGNYPNEVVESGWPVAYGGKLDFKADQEAPGRLGIGSTHPWPESYLEAGSLWEHLARHHVTFRNYGEGLETAGDVEDPGLEPTGVRVPTNMPMAEALFQNTSRDYATFNTNVSDQYRYQQFVTEFKTRYASGKEPLPQFLFIWLPNDHTADPRPAEGYPYRASYVADNDLALGKFIELFSHSQFWKDMAIFVTEDDAQDGTDHIDAHRSVLMVISPYSRRSVSHVHSSMASILKTFDLVLGLPPLNQYDAAAADLSDCFTSQPDFTPYRALPPDTRIFDPARVVEPGLQTKTNRRPSQPLDDPASIRKELRERR